MEHANFKLSDNGFARAYGKDCMGCKSTKSDVMLSFGAGNGLDVLNGNNEKISERKDILDLFISFNQAEMLYDELGKIIKKQKED